jgi:hypothetical protein
MALLTGIQPDFRKGSRRKPRSFGAVALLCLALVALLTLVQVAHVHAADSDPDHCSLCIALHSAAPVAVVAAVVVLVWMGSTALVFQPCPDLRHWRPKLFTRPPPAGCQGPLFDLPF